MFAYKIHAIVAVTLTLLNLLIVEAWFERSNYRVDLESNAVFPLKSLPYQRGTSTRVVFVGPAGSRMSLVCNINFSKGCRRSDWFGSSTISRRRQCCDDYFYVGFNLNRNIRGAERFCGKRNIRKNTQRGANRQPVIVVGKIIDCFSKYVHIFRFNQHFSLSVIDMFRF